MKFDILMGVPEMKKFWDDLCGRAEDETLGKDRKLFKKFVKCLNLSSKE